MNTDHNENIQLEDIQPVKTTKKRKAKGDGTYKDGNTWRFRTSVKLPRSGRTERVSGTPAINTREAARLAMQLEIQRLVDADINPQLHAERTRERWTLATLAEKVAEHVGARSRKATVAHYQAAFKAIASIWKDSTPIDEITSAKLLDLETALLGKYERSTAQLYLAKLRASMGIARDKGALATVPKFPSTKTRIKRDIRFLTEAETVKLLAAIDTGKVTDSVNFRPMVELALVTGMRFGEILGLQWRDLLDGKVHVTRQITEYGIGPTKSGQPRTVPLTATAQAVLDTLPRISEWVFARADGSPLNADTAGAWMSKAMELASIRFEGTSEPRWHALRHTFAVRLTRSGCPLPILRDLLGHSDIRTTEIYARYAPSDAATWMQRVFDPAPVATLALAA